MAHRIEVAVKRTVEAMMRFQRKATSLCIIDPPRSTAKSP